MSEYTLFDKYLLLGLKLRPDGRVVCMFCRRFGKHVGGGVVEVVHAGDCQLTFICIPGVKHDS